MNAASEAILAVDRSGMIVGANPAAVELLSDGAELRGRSIGDIARCARRLRRGGADR